jgi:hypothetical protein
MWGIQLPSFRQWFHTDSLGKVRSVLGAIRSSDSQQSLPPTDIGDPAFSCRGTINEAATQFTIALLRATALGYPLAWRKADGGRSISWIGTTITAHPTSVEVSFPRNTCEELALKTSTAVDRQIITTRELRSLAGFLNFIAGVVHPLRPFLSPLWAALSSRKPSERGPSNKTGRHDRLPRGLIQIQQCRRALNWISLPRKTNRDDQPRHKLHQTTYHHAPHFGRR